MRVDCTCRQCGGGFTTSQARIDDGRGLYCSRTCFFAAHAATSRVEQTCVYCGGRFTTKRWKVKHGEGLYCSRSCKSRAIMQPGETNPNWRGGRNISPAGYVRINVPDRGLVFEHRLVWEQAYGPVPDGSVLHHINGIKTDNRLDNLRLMTNAEHTSLHAAIGGRWSRQHDCCRVCGTIERRHNGRGLCTMCWYRENKRAA